MSDTKPTDDAKDEVLTLEKKPDAALTTGVDETADEAAAADDAAATGVDETSAADDGEKRDSKEPDVIPRGNPLRKRSAIIIAAGIVPAFLLMAKNGQNWWGVPSVCCSSRWRPGASWTSSARSTTASPTLPAARISTASLRPSGSRRCSSSRSALRSRSRRAAVGPWWVGSVTVTASFLGLVAAVFKLASGSARGSSTSSARIALSHRHGFWVLAIGALLYFPAMGLQSLWDPWETHYGEVAREILARDDWVSLWWAQDGWFWSKPILNFWIQSLAMASLGTHYHADMMLQGASGAWTAHPEWVCARRTSS